MMALIHIQDIAIHADGFTLAHEIGHGKFRLRHPDNDPKHLIPLQEENDGTPPSNGPFNINDTYNFMYHTSNGRVNRIRHYQWKKILTGIYKN